MAIKARMDSLGIDGVITTKDIGYELRCHDTIPFDIEYTRDLGFCAAQFLINGGTGALVVTDSGRFHPIYFKDLVDPVTKRTRVRMVDIEKGTLKFDLGDCCVPEQAGWASASEDRVLPVSVRYPSGAKLQLVYTPNGDGTREILVDLLIET